MRAFWRQLNNTDGIPVLVEQVTNGMLGKWHVLLSVSGPPRYFQITGAHDVDGEPLCVFRQRDRADYQKHLDSLWRKDVPYA